MAEDIHFSDRKDDIKRQKINGSYTEHIESDELLRIPGNMSFGDIVTENGKINSGASKSQKQQNKEIKKKKKKSRKIRRFIKSVLSSLISFILIVSVIITATAAFVLSDYKSTEFAENVHTDEEALLYSDDVFNILLMGIDTLDTGDSSRSDAMILLSVDSRNRQIKLSSFLRDSYVDIPGYGNMKLNAACVYGGPQLVCDTIEANFGIRIDEYAKVGYDMFIKIIDAVGGVTIPEIDETEAKALLREGFETEPGTDILLDGEQALKYCRIRKGQTDFYRTERQREVISLVLHKLPMSNPITLLNTAKEIAETIECSIEKNQFAGLVLKALTCLTGEIAQMTVPADGTWYDATKNYQAVLMIDFEENRELLNEFLYKQGE